MFKACWQQSICPGVLSATLVVFVPSKVPLQLRTGTGKVASCLPSKIGNRRRRRLYSYTVPIPTSPCMQPQVQSCVRLASPGAVMCMVGMLPPCASSCAPRHPDSAQVHLHSDIRHTPHPEHQFHLPLGDGCRGGTRTAGGAWCMVHGAARHAIYSSYRVRAAFMLQFARGMAYSIRRVDSRYGPRAHG